MADLVVGVLAVQGDFAEHAAMLRRAAADAQLAVTVREVRLPRHLDGLHGLVVPGGESTTIGKLLARWGLAEPIRTRGAAGFPIWGTCAGMILLAREVRGGAPEGALGLMDLAVQRNAFGRQVDSFETDLAVEGVPRPVHAVFIRAPVVEHVGAQAEALATLPDGRVVAARQGNLLATAYHPELTEDVSTHLLFLRLVRTYASVGTV